jgi:CDP-paratose 2-epimerase
LHAGPRKIFDINLAGSFNCFEAARQHHAAILFLSSSRVYPIPALRSLALREDETRFELEPTQPVPGVSVRGISEDCTPEGPRSFYGMTKRAGEMLLQEYMYQYDLRVLINRCGVIAGPWQMGRVDQGFMSLWMARHHFGQPLQYTGYRGSGKQVRDVLHVQDLFSLLAAQIQQADTWNGGIYNVGGGREQAVSLRELTALCESITGNRIAITGQPDTHTADVPLYISDNRRVAEAFDWQPRHTVESTARDIHAWLLQHEDQLAPLMDGRK